MPNPVVPELKDWLLRHEGDVAHGINDFGDLAPVFEHLWGRPASKMKVPRSGVVAPPAEAPEPEVDAFLRDNQDAPETKVE